ncbi:type III restriction endonuclease subunit R [Pleomorphomonas diazotrophica]|uniref:Type III restriction endonuclease subunit R n=1 Tax=Pleomorphomonas diazotrophica TaxID=1166257 RepID=A0A1I4UXE4_9HYPH|nr:DEAD/DEAH box helicase family protein [Pleomorphomonas diazotrophica]PKR89734.1 type III restriction endonuclease subunit R [Pleomorphomonas diazotrophica]SFM93596.1 Superfamily II DNA or RNA helicase [Pleomorphomonas diazotrophica]
MKFTLKDYQEEAVGKVLVNLKKASKRWREDGDKHAFSLTATTGAGKTVMAAAVFEALFHGDDNYDIEPDPGAVVIWFSDDPSLNEQSRYRLLQASDRLSISDLVVVQSTFQREALEPGKVYFLNTQKLSKSSLLVRGREPDEEADTNAPPLPMPDSRSWTIWDTIQNTIDDPALTLYLVLDEAHRGMRAATGAGEKTTIVKRLINGSGSVPGIPVVWGISATVERFNVAMADMQGRATLPNVIVDSGKVQASGLLKDTINLDVPKEVGQFDTVLVRRGTDKLKEISAAWAAYGAQQTDAGVVLPLMVLQVPNAPDHNEIGKALDTIFTQWPDLPEDAVAHVFGEHSAQTFGHHSVPYISPERVQDTSWVRVLIAKDAISTGWDCPRAEVMVSFRPALDKTHITQLLGRMVRTPLARRIPGNDRLNSVDCLLPFFDENSVKDVAKALKSGGDGGDALPGRRVLINPVELRPNPAIPEVIWDKLLSLPSQTLPKRHVRPVKRLTSLAHELAADDLLVDAGKLAHAEMHKVLDGICARYKAEIKVARSSVLTVEGTSLKADLKGEAMSFDDFLEEADYVVIEDAYRRAGRAISPDLATSYSKHLARNVGDQHDMEEALKEAHVSIAALGLVPQARETLDAEAEKLSNHWLTRFRVEIKGLTDERQDVYRQIKEMSANPMEVNIARPTSWMQTSTIREANGVEKPLQTFAKHLLCNEEGLFPDCFNSWEDEVIRAELDRPGTVAWYRNPSRASQDSLGIIYSDGAESKILRPDFVFFSQQSDGTVVADIVDPHGIQLNDAVPKLRGLAQYAAKYGSHYRRIEAVAKIGDKFRVLDLMEEKTRKAIGSASSVKELYESAVGSDYVV